ncbi:MAG TPA: lipoyl(octanoyl) transferase LipB [Phycisphaerales bacterium]|nr:lipoyl(octanoyl) transferase LipB [Phycisphaerales bacterium]
MSEIKDHAYPLRIVSFGPIAYAHALQMQQSLVDQRIKAAIPNTVLIMEHSPVITLGARKSENKLLVDEDEIKERAIDIARVRRGGGTTAHNPGQLVLYPIIDLRTINVGISEYVRCLESIGIDLLGSYGIEAGRVRGLPGLWLDDRRKIASIGVKVKRHVTFHGMAINICNDTAIFDLIVPCGLKDIKILSAVKASGRDIDINDAKEKIAKLCAEKWSAKELTEYEQR